MSKEGNSKEAPEDSVIIDGSEVSGEAAQEKQDKQEQPEEDFKEKYLRCLADMQNSKDLFAKQKNDAIEFATAKFAREMLVVLDIFEKAFSDKQILESEDARVKGFVDGIKMTKDQMVKSLNKFEIFSVNVLGEAFNPTLHEALMEIPTQERAQDGKVGQVFEQGYVIGNKLLRVAKVGVNKFVEEGIKKENSTEDTKQGEEK